MQDAQGDEGDPVFQHGLRIAAGIQYETETQGRRRRPNQDEQGGEVGNLRADEPDPRTVRGEQRQRRAVSHRPHRVAGQQQTQQPPACGVALLGRKPADSPPGLRRSEKKGYPQPPLQPLQPLTAAAATTTTSTTPTPRTTLSGTRSFAARAHFARVPHRASWPALGWLKNKCPDE